MPMNLLVEAFITKDGVCKAHEGRVVVVQALSAVGNPTACRCPDTGILMPTNMVPDNEEDNSISC